MTEWSGERRRMSAAMWTCSVIVIVCSTGCPPSRLDFVTDTVVELDGSVTRFIRYAATESAREELQNRYVLPEGGRWVSSTRMRYDASEERNYTENLDKYLVAKRYAPGESIPTDHLRCGETPGRNVENVVDVSVHDYFFFRTYEFQETFRDVKGHEEFLTSLKRQYPTWVDRLATAMVTRLEGVTKEKASHSIEKIARPWVEKLLKGEPIDYQRLSPEVFDANSPFAEALMNELSPVQHGEREARLEAIEDSIEEANNGFDDDEVDRVVFDVYPLELFSNREYRVQQTLSMPGTIFDTNATAHDGHSLAWEFDPELLLVQEHVAKARSRVLFPLRIAGAVSIVLLAALWARRRRSIAS